MKERAALSDRLPDLNVGAGYRIGTRLRFAALSMLGQRQNPDTCKFRSDFCPERAFGLVPTNARKEPKLTNATLRMNGGNVTQQRNGDID